MAFQLTRRFPVKPLDLPTEIPIPMQTSLSFQEGEQVIPSTECVEDIKSGWNVNIFSYHELHPNSAGNSCATQCGYGTHGTFFLVDCFSKLQGGWMMAARKFGNMKLMPRTCFHTINHRKLHDPKCICGIRW